MNLPVWTESIQEALNRATENKLSSVAVDALALARLFEAWQQERTMALTLQSERGELVDTKDRALRIARGCIDNLAHIRDFAETARRAAGEQ